MYTSRARAYSINMRETQHMTPRQQRLHGYSNDELQQVLEGWDPRLEAEVPAKHSDDARFELESRGLYAA